MKEVKGHDQAVQGDSNIPTATLRASSLAGFASGRKSVWQRQREKGGRDGKGFVPLEVQSSEKEVAEGCPRFQDEAGESPSPSREVEFTLQGRKGPT